MSSKGKGRQGKRSGVINDAAVMKRGVRLARAAIIYAAMHGEAGPREAAAMRKLAAALPALVKMLKPVRFKPTTAEKSCVATASRRSVRLKR